MSSAIPRSVVAAIVFLTVLGSFAYGVAVMRFLIFPYELIHEMEYAAQDLAKSVIGSRSRYQTPTRKTERLRMAGSKDADKSLSLVSSMAAGDVISLAVIDIAGKVINAWEVDWFDVWPDATHLLDKELPKTRPGAHIHGMALLDDGSVVFNFANLGMVRMSACSEVIWRLPYRTHHSIFVDDDGHIWVPAQRRSKNPLAEYPSHASPVSEPMILQVSRDGEILQEISILDILANNNLRALFHMNASAKGNVIKGDNLHTNDVEIFPASMEEGVFKHGDVMISMRNINTVLVFNPQDGRVRYVKTGGFVRQHDPDFIDGNTISLFDNNNIGPENFGQQSRVVLVDARSGDTEVYYTGSAEEPFFTDIMGNHQWLDDGHLLITESVKGRSFEIDSDKKIVWEYVNIVASGTASYVEEVQRVPPEFAEIFAGRDCLDTSNPTAIIP